jgi:hypothetical protein
MEALFANAEVVARWDEWNFNTAVGRLSLLEGEGEGEGSSMARWSRAGLSPSPQFSSFGARGEAKRAANCLPASQTKCPRGVTRK